MLNCLGIKRVDFTNDNGEVIKGYNLWFSDTMPSAGWVGCEVYKKFLTDKVVSDLGISVADLPGHEVMVTYGRRDRIEQIEIIG